MLVWGEGLVPVGAEVVEEGEAGGSEGEDVGAGETRGEEPPKEGGERDREQKGDDPGQQGWRGKIADVEPDEYWDSEEGIRVEWGDIEGEAGEFDSVGVGGVAAFGASSGGRVAAEVVAAVETGAEKGGGGVHGVGGSVSGGWRGVRGWRD